jgi:hypothetical protein
MILHLALLINSLLLLLHGSLAQSDITTEYDLPVTSICGNIEFNVNFMTTDIYISNPYKINNITI